MTRQSTLLTLIGMAGMVISLGCAPQAPYYLGCEKPVPNTSVEMATKIDYPDAELESLNEVDEAQAPYSLANSNPKEIWDLTLEEAIRYALENSKVMRNLGGVSFGASGSVGVPTSLLSSPSAAMTVWHPAITESDPRYGVEGVLSDFDASWNTNTYWGKSLSPQNSSSRPYAYSVDSGTFQSYIQKKAATGGTFTVGHNITYEHNNDSATMVRDHSYWNSNVQVEFTQPWLQGGGVQFNRIAGTNASPGYYNGVMIARLKTDTALCDFETGVEGLVYDTERAYWELYYAYRLLDTVLAGRNSALQTWRQVYAKYIIGHTGGSAQEEAQSRQQYFQFRSSVEQSLSNLYSTENKLRYIMGLTTTDGRLIRPATEPTTARIVTEWETWHCEALVRNIALRKQKWVIKQRQLELIASKNFLLPELNTFGSYQWNGMGRDLLDSDNSKSNAYGSLTHDGMGEWQLGVYLSVPLGFRQGRAAVRNAELNLLREKAILQEQELELTHQLAQSVRDLQDYYILAQTNYNRRAAAQREVEATTAAYEQGTATLNLVLDAQRRMAEAESDYFRSVTDYNEAIITTQKYKSSLLEYNGITLCEGPWAGKAYFDAQKRAEMRRRGKYINYGFTVPRVISKGSYNQQMGLQMGAMPTTAIEQPTTATASQIPTAPVESILSNNGAKRENAPTAAPMSDDTLGEVHEVKKETAEMTVNAPVALPENSNAMALTRLNAGFQKAQNMAEPKSENEKVIVQLDETEAAPANKVQKVNYETIQDSSSTVAPAAPGLKKWVNPLR